jgi:hypothetical protein
MCCLAKTLRGCCLPKQEIDYKLEGENADRFRTNFAGTPWIKVPRVLWDFTAEQARHPPPVQTCMQAGSC